MFFGWAHGSLWLSSPDVWLEVHDR